MTRIEAMNVEQVVRASLEQFIESLQKGEWTGRREREFISLYAFGHLLPVVQSARGDPTQIGIEVPVPQLPKEIEIQLSRRTSAKDQVCKDLVIWGEPRQTCWDSNGGPTVAPLAILEWKVNEGKEPSTRDIKWLTAFTQLHPACTGYVICMNARNSVFALECWIVRNGKKPELLVSR